MVKKKTPIEGGLCTTLYDEKIYSYPFEKSPLNCCSQRVKGHYYMK